MPRTTVYIRNEDWAKWKAVGNKSELISQSLNGVVGKAEKVIEPQKTPRTAEDVINEIRLSEAARDEELSLCQDQETYKALERGWNLTIQGLWNEYNELKS